MKYYVMRRHLVYGVCPTFSLVLDDVKKHISLTTTIDDTSDQNEMIDILAQHIVLCRKIRILFDDLDNLENLILSFRKQVSSLTFRKYSLFAFYNFLERHLRREYNIRTQWSGELLSEMIEKCVWKFYDDYMWLSRKHVTPHGYVGDADFLYQGLPIRIIDLYNFKRFNWITSGRTSSFDYLGKYPFTKIGLRQLDRVFQHFCDVHEIMNALLPCDGTESIPMLNETYRRMVIFERGLKKHIEKEKQTSAYHVISAFVTESIQPTQSLDKLLYAPPDGLMVQRTLRILQSN
jgi:hypothetical protein